MPPRKTGPEPSIRDLRAASSRDDVVSLDDVFGARFTVFPTTPFAVEGDAAAWRGHAGVREWARALFALRHQADATGHTEEQGRVTWRYRARVDPYQAVPGVPPAEGTDVLQPGDDLLQVAIDYIAANSPVAPTVEGRIEGP